MPGETIMLPSDLQHLQGLRVHDLVAKLAGVAARDTARVMVAAELVTWFLEAEAIDVLLEPFNSNKPSALNAAKCEEAHAYLVSLLKEEGDPIVHKLRGVKQCV